MAETELPDFEGTPVYAASARITNLGDGLSKAAETDKIVIHQGDKVRMIIEGECIDVQHPKQSETDGLTRKHVIKAGTIAFVDEDVVGEILDEQRRKNEELKGIKELPFDEDAEPEVVDADAPGLAAVPDA